MYDWFHIGLYMHPPPTDGFLSWPLLVPGPAVSTAFMTGCVDFGKGAQVARSQRFPFLSPGHCANSKNRTRQELMESSVVCEGSWVVGFLVGKSKTPLLCEKVCSQIAKPEAITFSMVSLVLCMTVFRARVCSSAYICRLEFIEHTDAEV